MDFSTSRLEQALQPFFAVQVARFRPWTYETPLLISHERINALREAQRVMHQLICHLSAHYPRLSHRLPHRPEIKALLHALADLPHTVGTFRTDFVVGEDNAHALIEVTCRYPLNGYFTSLALNQVVDSTALTDTPGLQFTDLQQNLPAHFCEWIGDSKRLCLVLGDDNRGNESKHLPGMLRKAGLEVHEIPVRDWPAVADTLLPEAAIVAELDFDEWLSLPVDLIRRMIQRPLLNDPRTVFLVHDKSFFALAHDRELVAEAMTAEDGDILRAALAPTYLPGQAPEAWNDARSNPSDWVLKPRSLGRSVDILAGHLTSAADWAVALNNAATRDFVLQRWTTSRRIAGRVGGVTYEDYFVGTLLYWGLDFFGPGLFRASSWPITNVKDDRKVAYRIIAGHPTGPATSSVQNIPGI